jgi:hypothetical protein
MNSKKVAICLVSAVAAGQRDKLAARKGKTSVKKAKPGNRKQITRKKAKTTKKGRKVRV